MINVQGTDHHSTVTRVRAGLQALGIGIPQGYPDYVLHSLVKVMRGGEEVKISKRAGTYVTVRDLIDWVGPRRGALLPRVAQGRLRVRLRRRPRAREERGKPGLLRAVRARARLQRARAMGRRRGRAGAASIWRRWRASKRARARAAARRSFPKMLGARGARSSRRTRSRSTCATLAGEFHSYYNAERILVEDEALARGAACAVRGGAPDAANGLALLGVSAPEKM